MTSKTAYCPVAGKHDKFATPIADGGDDEGVSKEERKRQVLEFLVESGVALPRTPLYRNLSYQGANFSDSSLKNYLSELRDEGYIERIDAEKFADGQVSVSDDDPGYWVATSDGYDLVEEYRSEQSDDIDTSHL